MGGNPEVSQRLKRSLKLAAFAIIITVIVLVVILPAGTAYLYIHGMLHRECSNLPEPPPDRLTSAGRIQAITLEPESGVVLDGWFVPGTSGAAVIVLPGAYGGANSMEYEVDLLQQAGYNVLTYDTRSCASPPQITSLGYTEIQDLTAALDWLQQQPGVDPNRIGVMGYSMGGATAIMGAAQDERIQAVIALGNYGDLASDIRRDAGGDQPFLERWMRGWIERFYEWQTGVDVDQVRPVAVIGQISPRPVLLIHGSLEVESNRALAQYENAGEPKDLWIVEGAWHSGYRRFAPQEYDRRVLEFFETYLSEDA